MTRRNMLGTIWLINCVGSAIIAYILELYFMASLNGVCALGAIYLLTRPKEWR